MAKNLLLLSLAASFSAAVYASSGLSINDPAILKADDSITVNFSVDPANYKVKGNNLLVITPAIAGATDTLRLDPVTLAGKNAWYQEVRAGRRGANLLRAGKKNTMLDYSRTVKYEPWMEQSELVMIADTVSECNCDFRSGIRRFAKMDFTPATFTTTSETFAYIEPVDTIEKIFNLSGRANIIFKVNRTDIDWTYKSNYAELDSILTSINAVKDNPDATVERITLTGYASPEGPYANNERLAAGRTEVVKNYVASHGDFPPATYSARSVAEDWAGLRAWLVASTVPDKDAIIALIDNPDIKIEVRNDRLRAAFPDTYRFLLENVYPNLRHTDYLITYRIRRYYEVDEIAAVMATNPGNLSLNEMFILANSYGKGSEKSDEVFLTAARLFPDSEVANINAAYSAINRDDLTSARLFLSRVKPSPETEYARGVILAREGNFAEAIEILTVAAGRGIPGAQKALDDAIRASTPSQHITFLE